MITTTTTTTTKLLTLTYHTMYLYGPTIIYKQINN